MEPRELDQIEAADFRLSALEATNRLQKEIGFGDHHKANVENTIFNSMRDAYQRGAHAVRMDPNEI